jgi:glycosyltransferase involved in cell wall biosynthesis
MDEANTRPAILQRKMKGDGRLMKIGQFTDTLLPVVDGVGRVVSNYAQAMGRLCEACYVIAPQQKNLYQGSLPYEIVDFSSIPLPKLQQYRAGLPALDAHYLSRIAQVQLDIAHAHSPFIAGREAYRISRRQGIPLVGTFHSKYYDDFYQYSHSSMLSSMGNRLVIDFFSKCDQVWAVSNSTAEVLRRYGFTGPVEVVENGTDRKEPDIQAAQMVEERFDLGQRPLLLYVGQMNWKKNIRRILEVVDVLIRQGRDIRLIMAGQGPSEQEIRALSAALGLEDAVVHAGHITDVRLLDGLYTRADLFVFPSLYDNAPMVVREAAAVGTPSLLTRGSSAAEVVRDGENGLLADDTTADMAACIAWALDNPVRLREIGMAAWATIPKPWEEVITEVLARYEDLIRTMQRSRRCKTRLRLPL